MPEYIRKAEKFQAVSWTGSNASDIVTLVNTALKMTFTSGVSSGTLAVVLVSNPDYTIYVPPLHTVLAGPYVGNINTLGAPVTVITTARFQNDFQVTLL